MLSHVLGCLGVLCLGGGALMRTRERSIEVAAPTPGEPVSSGSLHSDADRLWFSVEGLRAQVPDMAVDRTLSRRQQEAVVISATVVLFAIAITWKWALMAVLAVCITLYFAALVARLMLFSKSLNRRGIVRVSDELARSVPDRMLPAYTILVPAYAEPEVVRQLVANLEAIEYPADKLQCLLLLEADDEETIAAARQVAGAESPVDIVLVPPGGPRTKPKALNYGLALATGEIITIFDAEDRPSPLQLRQAALALSTAPRDVVCMQARLDFYNPTQNLLTKWFTLDYRMWFTQLLPGLVQMGAPIPLGGTSNHFRKSVLLEVGAWDPYNVTEDADLGIRLHRLGYRTAVLDSTTLEEANSDVINWVKQRSRWYKGYAQTALVHLRHPRRLYAEIGRRPFTLFALFVGGTPLLAMLNSVFWTMTLTWWTFHPFWLRVLFPALMFWLGLICFVVGNLAVLYSWVLSTREPQEKLWLAAITSPLYWVLMSLAAAKALVQLVIAPSYWEKTTHGLDQPADVEQAIA